MTEVTRAVSLLLTAGFAAETRIDNAKARVHQTFRVRETIIIIGVWPDDLADTHIADRFWGEQTELNLSDSLWAGHVTPYPPVSVWVQFPYSSFHQAAA